MPKPKAHHRASRIALLMLWQLVTLIASTFAQAELHSTQEDPSDACTRAPEIDGSTEAPGAHFLCFSFEPLSTTAAEQTSPPLVSFSAQETSSVLSSSVMIPQSTNSTSDNVLSTSTLYTTLRGDNQTTSAPTPGQLPTMTNGTISSNATTSPILSHNSTTDSKSSLPTAALSQDGDGATNATMSPVVLQTVTYTTTICPSGGLA